MHLAIAGRRAAGGESRHLCAADSDRARWRATLDGMPLARLAWRQRRRDHLAANPAVRQPPLQRVAARARS